MRYGVCTTYSRPLAHNPMHALVADIVDALSSDTILLPCLVYGLLSALALWRFHSVFPGM